MKHVTISIIIFMCIASIAFGAERLADGCRYPLNIVQQSYTQSEPNVASKGDSVFVTWIDNRNDPYPERVYFKRSVNKGFTWGNDVYVTDNGNDGDTVNTYLDIAIDNTSGMIYLLWTSGPNSSSEYALKFAKSTNRGDNWDTEVDLASDLYKKPCGSIHVDGDGDVHVAYYEENDDGNELRYLKSTNQGSTFPIDNEACNIEEGDDVLETVITAVDISNTYCPQIAFSYDYGGSDYEIWHAHNEGLGWTAAEMGGDDGYEVGNTPYWMDMCCDSDEDDTLYFCFSRTDVTPYLVSYRRGTYDGGWDWTDPDTLSKNIGVGGNDPVIVAYGSNPNLQVVWKSGGSGILYYSLSTDGGTNWTTADYLWAGDGGNVDPAISAGANERHVVFSRSTDIYYLANDDLLLSNIYTATAYNGGRHLWRDETELKKAHLHLVYTSQGRPHYTFSTDGGTNWDKYHIIEEPPGGVYADKDSGYYPTVGLLPDVTASPPCIVFIDDGNNVVYRWDSADVWKGFTILSSAASGFEPGPPSLVTYGDSVYVAFSIANDDPYSAICFYQFIYNAGAAYAETLESGEDDNLENSKVSITIDGSRDPYVAWSKKTGTYNDIFFCWRNSGSWESIETVLADANANLIFPHLDDFGNDLSVVFWKSTRSVSEIYRREWNIPGEDWYDDAYRHSVSGDYTEYPVNVAHDFSVWPQKAGLPLQLDIRYKSDTYGSGWVSQASENEYFCHSQLQRDETPWDLYTIFTKGDGIPYHITSVHQQFGGRGFGNNSPLYTVETGEDTASVFCIQRDAAIVYEGYSVDYADEELIYDLPLLEPLFPYHLIRGTIYFEGTGNKTHELWINGEKMLKLEVNANQPLDFEMPIPRDFYQNEYRVTLSVKNSQTNGVYLAQLDVCRLTEDQYGGGTQSTGTCELKSQNQMFLTPNPFSKTLNIKLQIADLQLQGVTLKVYDITGRLVRNFNLNVQNTLCPVPISWDGCDDTGARLPNGIYFLELKSGTESITGKVVILK